VETFSAFSYINLIPKSLRGKIENVNFSDTLATPSDNVSTSGGRWRRGLGYSGASKWPVRYCCQRHCKLGSRRDM